MTELQERVIRGLRSPFTDVRLWACRSALKKELSLSIKEVRPLFSDKSRRVQREAVRLAGLRRLTSAVPDLIDLLNSADSDLSLQAAVALNLISGRKMKRPKPRKVIGLGPKGELPTGPSAAALAAAPATLHSLSLPPSERPAPRSIAPLPGEREFEERFKESSSMAIYAFVCVLAAFVCGIFVGPAFQSEPLRSEELTLRQSFARLLEQLNSPEDKAALTKAFALILEKEKGQGELHFEEGRVQPTVAAQRQDSQVPTIEPTIASTIEPAIEPTKKPTSQPISQPNPTSTAKPQITSAKSLSTEDEEKLALWFSMGLRYLESGRPEKVKALVRKIYEVNPHSERAQRLKRLARERYGVIE